jgi:hypothetical protein
MINENIREGILSKIDFLLAGINDNSVRTDDLMIAQTVQALSEAYKNLEVNNFAANKKTIEDAINESRANNVLREIGIETTVEKN